MFKLLKLKENSFAYVGDKEYYESTLKGIYAYMRNKGIDDDEIEMGIFSLELNNHDVADYGVHKKFIYSKKAA